MSAPADTFAAFLDWVAVHLDDHQVRASELAAELYVSRSLLDRFVAASAGEPPGHFRRRLLLERAAFRLRSTQASVIEVAIEAGYASNEAFTRAFRRAYGSSGWRSSARSIHIDSPSGIHFYSPGGLRLPAQLKATDMYFVAEMIDHHVAQIGELIDRASALTDEELDRPLGLPFECIDTEPTIRSVLSRLVSQLDMWMAAMADENYGFDVEQHKEIAAMRTGSTGPDRRSLPACARSTPVTGSTRPSSIRPAPHRTPSPRPG